MLPNFLLTSSVTFWERSWMSPMEGSPSASRKPRTESTMFSFRVFLFGYFALRGGGGPWTVLCHGCC